MKYKKEHVVRVAQLEGSLGYAKEQLEEARREIGIIEGQNTEAFDTIKQL